MLTTIKIRTLKTLDTYEVKTARGKHVKKAVWNTDKVFIQRDYFTHLDEVLRKENANAFIETVKSIFYRQYGKQKCDEVVYVHDNCDINEVVNETYLELSDNYDRYLDLEDTRPVKMIIGLAVYRAVKRLYASYRDSMMIHAITSETMIEEEDGTRHYKREYGYKPITRLEAFTSDNLLFGDYHKTPESEYIEDETAHERLRLLGRLARDIDNLFPWYRDVVIQLARGKTLKAIASERGVSYVSLRKQVSRARLVLKAIYNR